MTGFLAVMPILAFVLSVVSLILSLSNYLRDRARIVAWCDVIYHRRGPTPECETPVLRIRIANRGRRPAALLSLVKKTKSFHWSTTLRPPQLSKQSFDDFGDLQRELMNHMLAQNSAVRLLEGEVMDMQFEPDDHHEFITWNDDEVFVAENLFIEDYMGRRYRVRNDRKCLETLLSYQSTKSITP